MRFLSLQSGSHGNSFYVEAGSVRLLFDAGLSGAQLEERLAARGTSPEGIDALIISHEHADHVRHAGVLSRRFKLPVYITERTLAAAQRSARLGALSETRFFKPGDSFAIGGNVTIHTVATPHDAVDGAIFVVDDGVSRLGICTDVGHVFAGLRTIISGVDALYLESNYDPAMLAASRYHAGLKRRITGPGGHLSNIEAATAVATNATERLQWLCIGHFSEENNDPNLALTTHRSVIGDDLPIHISGRYGVTDWMDVALMPRSATAAFWCNADDIAQRRSPVKTASGPKNRTRSIKWAPPVRDDAPIFDFG